MPPAAPGLASYPPNPLLSPHHHAAVAAHAHVATLQQQHQQHSLYLQHQQYQQQLQQQHQRRVASQPHSSSHAQAKIGQGRTNGEPETITLSDDDDAQNGHISPPLKEHYSVQVTSKHCYDKEPSAYLAGKDPPQNCKGLSDSSSQNKNMPSVISHDMKTEDSSKLVVQEAETGYNAEKSEKMFSNDLNTPPPRVSHENISPARIKKERLSDLHVSLNGSNVDHEISSESVDGGNESKELRRFSRNALKNESGTCDEGFSFEITPDSNIVCAMTLLQFSESGFDCSNAFNITSDLPSVANSEGLDILLAGIEIRTFQEMETWRDSNYGIDMLCSLTRQDCYRMGLGESCYKIGLDVLCDVTKDDYLQFLYWIDPIMLLKHQFRIREYRNDARAMMCRNFIAERMLTKKEETLLTLDENFCSPNAKIKSLDQVIRKIKNTEIMSQLEVRLREQICHLQNLFSEKQKEVSRLKLTPNKVKKLKTKRQRGPGRPKKRCLKSIKSKMGRPRKTRGSCESNEFIKGDRLEHLEDIDVEEDEESRIMTDEHNLLPPVLEPFKGNSARIKHLRKSTESPPPPPLIPMMETFGNGSHVNSTTTAHTISNLLRPPKLTANSSSTQQGTCRKTFTKNRLSVTNLSTINEKFMKGKANPFANLLTKLATSSSGTQNGNTDKDLDITSQSDAEEDDKDKVSQSDGEESDKHEQEIESSTTEEEEEADVSRHKRNSKERISNGKNEHENKVFSSCKKSNVTTTDNDSQVPENRQSIEDRGSRRKINAKQGFSIQEYADNTEHSSEQNVSSDFEDSYSTSAQKKRKSDKPKKHFGGTNEVETIVPKKPKNLFMMNCLKIQQNQKELKRSSGGSVPQIKKDEYDFTDEDDDHEIIKIGKHRKSEPTTTSIASNTNSQSPSLRPIVSDIASPSKTFSKNRGGSTTAPTNQQQKRQPLSSSNSASKESGDIPKEPSRPKSAASNSSVSSIKNPNQSSVR